MRRSRLRLLAAMTLAGIVVAAWAAPRIVRRFDMQGLRPVTVATGLDNPWALAFLPDGRMLVTERIGRLRVVSREGAVSPPLAGLPPVYASGEGGLMDVAVDPAFASNARLYWSFSEPAPDGGSRTVVARGTFRETALEDVQVIFRPGASSRANEHFGSRLLFGPDGTLFVSLGERGERAAARSAASPLGKILRMTVDGEPPMNNPFVDRADALPQVWSQGHRNVQGLAIDPRTGMLWATEHGPQGGDELNRIEPGRDYGWPTITYGCEYASCAPIGQGTQAPGLEQPVAHWSPEAIAPTGMAFLTSDRYNGWKGDLFIGMLQGRALLRLHLDGDRVVAQQHLLTGLRSRIRDVKQGPDGWLYIAAGRADGRILRVER